MQSKLKPSKEGRLLLYEFIGQIFVVPRKWYADERLTFHRAFPDVLFKMFKAWYAQSHHGETDEYIDGLYPDLETFALSFEKILKNIYRLGCEQKESRGEYALSRFDFRYSLSKCRFSKRGLTIYASILHGGDSISDEPK